MNETKMLSASQLQEHWQLLNATPKKNPHMLLTSLLHATGATSAMFVPFSLRDRADCAWSPRGSMLVDRISCVENTLTVHVNFTLASARASTT